MTFDQKNWEIQHQISKIASESLKYYDPLLQQLMYNRGIATKEQAELFLRGGFTLDPDPFQFRDMELAVNRISFAIDHDQKIAVYGDYDVDGVTSTALLVSFFRELGADVVKYIPDRFTEGYGLNFNAIDKLKSIGTDLLITVDCGIRAVKEVEFANRKGIDVIITDHHTPGFDLPNAFAVIDPKMPDDQYPEKMLAGVGVAYKLASALAQHSETHNIRSENYLDLVAIGTIADLAPLTGENRALVKDGISLLRNTNKQGLWSLMNLSRVNPQNISSTDIGFVIGPRLNAAGRIDSADIAYNLIMEDDPVRGSELSQELEIINRKRQILTQETQSLAKEIATKDLSDDSSIYIAADRSFNEGVVGLAASRLVEDFYRPSIVASIGAEYTRASCRSIPEFHITRALDKCSDLLEHHGGHASAAGFTVLNENFPELKERLRSIADAELGDNNLIPSLQIDCEIQLSELTPDFYNEIQKLKPFGYGNPTPLFTSMDVMVHRKFTVGQDKSHLKLILSDGRITFDAIAFRLGYLYAHLTDRIDIVYSFEINEYNGRKNYQLNIKDIKLR